MQTVTMNDLRGQLLILEQIKNPSPWVSDAINKLKSEINKAESRNGFLSPKQAASEELNSIIAKYPQLEIKYSITENNQRITNEHLTLPQPDTGIHLVTHLNGLENR